jgi:uncharacterized protein
MNNHHKINYIEFPSKDLGVTKEFFSSTFEWGFIDYGPEYVAITGAGIDGGFFKSNLTVSAEEGSALIVLYSNQLEETEAKVIQHSGSITKPTFPFPGGRRFHFKDPNGNEYAVWSDQEKNA